MSGIPKYSARRDNNEDDIINVYETMGCSVHRLSAPGIPDLLIGRHGITCVVEVKDVNGIYTPAQHQFNKTFKGYRRTVRTVQDAVDHVNELTLTASILGRSQ